MATRRCDVKRTLTQLNIAYLELAAAPSTATETRTGISPAIIEQFRDGRLMAHVSGREQRRLERPIVLHTQSEDLAIVQHSVPKTRGHDHDFSRALNALPEVRALIGPRSEACVRLNRPDVIHSGLARVMLR